MISGWSVLEKNLSFVMMPILFSRIAMLDKTMLNRIGLVFTTGVLVASLICLSYAFWRNIYQDFSGGYYYNEFTSIINSHPTYMAYYVCFSIIFLLYLVSYEMHGRLQRILITIVILFLSFILMLTAGRSTFVSMLMMASFFFLKLLFEPYPIKRKLQAISVTIVLLLLILFQSSYSPRILAGFLEGTEISAGKIQGDTWERLVLWESAINASSNIYIGVGTGDYTDVITNYYKANNLPKFAESSFNAHNQFIQTFFSNGLIGLLVLLITLLRPILMAAERQNIFGMLTFFPFLIYGISEVFLGRYQGLIFFVLLHQIFVKYLNQNLFKFSIKSFSAR